MFLAIFRKKKKKKINNNVFIIIGWFTLIEYDGRVSNVQFINLM